MEAKPYDWDAWKERQKHYDAGFEDGYYNRPENTNDNTEEYNKGLLDGHCQRLHDDERM